MWTVIGGTTMVINAGPGDQLDPHISGALVTYASIVSGASEVRYYDLLTGADQSIPADGGLDYLPDMSGSKVVYGVSYGFCAKHFICLCEQHCAPCTISLV